ncbi:MAG: IS110 family transposase, partial [bacterium]|nr:IS110 family transposase [bacterium]
IRYFQSGESTHRTPRISRQGSGLLRVWLYYAALNVVKHDGQPRTSRSGTKELLRLHAFPLDFTQDTDAGRARGGVGRSQASAGWSWASGEGSLPIQHG